MLLGDAGEEESDMDFKGDVLDPRFKTLVDKNKQYALDP
eukprot:CAMPEP_0168627556 /NCGR_PEP_ID=MMETSP0449_2-20121227/11327_1 /TAXON_ID=1082188 /ORGANISM="Strombidium rassoulzadegani, Strain ras09" /LENGTH=38 /DNA_ID= /DNA_START= /DNA_END= /DNA_ORIENTATION=